MTFFTVSLSDLGDLLLCHEDQVPKNHVRTALFDHLSGVLGVGDLVPKVSEDVALVGVVKVFRGGGPKLPRKAVFGVTKGGGLSLDPFSRASVRP